MKYRDQIFELHAQGLSKSQIIKQLGCLKSLVYYHLGPQSYRDNTYKRQVKSRSTAHPIARKVDNFKARQKRLIAERAINTQKAIYDKIRDFFKDRKTSKMNQSTDFTVSDVLSYLGDDPKCYLSGKSIDLSLPKTYALDHITPVSRGGDKSLSNMGLCTAQINQAKNNMTPEEFIELCRAVSSYN